MTSAALLVLSQSPYDFGFLALAALVPWLVAVQHSTSIEAFALSVLMGVVYALVAASWLVSAFQSQGVYGFHALLGTLAAAFWAKGLLFGLVGWLAHRLRNRNATLRVWVSSALFGLAEYWISDSEWGLPLLLLGHSQHSIPGVAQLAVAVGVPGISMLLFGLNSALALVVVEGGCRIRGAAVWAMAWLAIAVAGLPIARAFAPPPSPSVETLLVVQPDFLREHRWEAAYQEMILDQIAAETSRAIAEFGRAPSAIVWPENLLTFPVSQDTRLGRRLQEHVQGWDVPLVVGLVRGVRGIRGSKSGRYRNSAVWWSPLIGETDAVDKVRAIPWLESSRTFWGQDLVSRFIGEGATGPKVEEALVARPLRGEFTLSTVLCFEILFPAVVADRRDRESVAIVNLADDSWVKGEAVDAQLVAAAVFRAIESRLILVRISHGGLSVVIDRFGERVASLEPNTVDHLFVEVSAAPPPSNFEKIAISSTPLIAALALRIFSRSGRRIGRWPRASKSRKRR